MSDNEKADGAIRKFDLKWYSNEQIKATIEILLNCGVPETSRAINDLALYLKGRKDGTEGF